jgi:hypothetical protein
MQGNRNPQSGANPFEELFRLIGGGRRVRTSFIDLSELLGRGGFGAPMGGLEELLKMAKEGCPCPSCQAKKNLRGQFEIDTDGKTILAFLLPYHDEIGELIALKREADWFNDSPIWTDIFAGKLERFEEISDAGKKHWLYYLSLIKKALSERRHQLSKEDLSEINSALDEATGKAFLPWTRKKTTSRIFSSFIDQLKEEMLSCKDDEEMEAIRDRIGELQEQIPADLLNATEAPRLELAHDDIPEAIKMFQYAKKVGINNARCLEIALTNCKDKK